MIYYFFKLKSGLEFDRKYFLKTIITAKKGMK